MLPWLSYRHYRRPKTIYCILKGCWPNLYVLLDILCIDIGLSTSTIHKWISTTNMNLSIFTSSKQIWISCYQTIDSRMNISNRSNTFPWHYIPNLNIISCDWFWLWQWYRLQHSQDNYSTYKEPEFVLYVHRASANRIQFRHPISIIHMILIILL